MPIITRIQLWPSPPLPTAAIDVRFIKRQIGIRSRTETKMETQSQIRELQRNVAMQHSIAILGAHVIAELAMVIDISHPIQSLFTSEEGISRH